MISRPSNWDEVDGIEFGDYEVLKLGGHEVVIKNAYEHTNEQTGNKTLKIEVDIAGNDKQADFFQKQYDNDNRKDKKWPNGACRYLSLKQDDNCVSLFKGFTTSVENSNSNYLWNWDEKTLIGKKVCGVFCLEEYVKQDGTIGVATKLDHFRSLDKLPEVQMPKVKLVDGTKVDYEEYKKSNVEITGDGIDEFIENNLSSENMLD